jgi:SAM-dependent methyltransferase
MCHASCLRFGLEVLKREHIQGRCVLEVGARNVNGSLRPALCALDPAEYFGIDLEPGPGVDAICDVTRIAAQYGSNRWDVVVCTEVLEHVWDWSAAVSNLKQALVPGGCLVLTTRSQGFPYHPFPFDFWRFEPSDLSASFDDLILLRVEKDPDMPGVFLAAKKPVVFREKDLSRHAVYSMLCNRRIPRPSREVLEEFLTQLGLQREWLAALEGRHRQLLQALPA